MAEQITSLDRDALGRLGYIFAKAQILQSLPNIRSASDPLSTHRVALRSFETTFSRRGPCIRPRPCACRIRNSTDNDTPNSPVRSRSVNRFCRATLGLAMPKTSCDSIPFTRVGPSSDLTESLRAASSASSEKHVEHAGFVSLLKRFWEVGNQEPRGYEDCA